MIKAGFIKIDLLNYINKRKHEKLEAINFDLKSEYQGKLSFSLK